jgi:16S rRNA (uracil1498-N3)-methyltransferase
VNIFYIPAPGGSSIIIPEEESTHAVRVLRMKDGEAIEMMDGKGYFYKGRILRAHARNCEVEILGEPQFIPPRPYRIHLAIAPTKSNDRFEWMLEKATEIGVDRITPVFCEHSERTVLKIERLQKVLVSAMKQSMQAWLPLLDEPVKFNAFLQANREEDSFICTCTAGEDLLLKKQYQPLHSVTLLVGPEGDFTEQEIREAIGKGFRECSLGSSRLRTETAGLAACHAIHILNQ